MLRRTVSAFGRFNRMKRNRKVRPTDNTPDTSAAVEWLPRPVRMSWGQLRELQDWSMRRQLENDYTDVNKMRDIQREWGQHPPRPVLGDTEPKMPRGVYKDNHVARVRFLYRWHRANSPNNWLWLPRTGRAPERRAHASDYPENWKVLRDADLHRARR